MPASERAILRVHGHGGVEVDFVTSYLADFRHAYESIAVFESMFDGLRRAERDFQFSRYPFPLDIGLSLSPRRVARYVRTWPPTSEDLASSVPRSEKLILEGVRLSSPGFWDFLGKLNPLEVLRQYLTDRHERRKDREYRESAEKRRLALENLDLENRVIADRIAILKDRLGASDADLAPLLNELIHKPITALDRHQDRGMIEHAEFLRTESGDPGKV